MLHSVRLHLLVVGLGLTAASGLAAQGLGLDKSGGALGGPVTVSVRGNPNEPYVILFAPYEQQTPVTPLGITLDIPLTSAAESLTTPGLTGNTNGSGNGSFTTTVPNAPALQNVVISLQAVAGTGPYRVSNLARLTPQLSRTFAAPLNQPAVPVSGGTTAAMVDGELLFLGGSGPVAQVYSSRLEEWRLAGASFGVGLLSQSTTLADGRILFTGGLDLATGQPTSAAAIYDPTTQATTTVAMSSARAGHGASLMGNGRVLITGGMSSFNLADPLSLFAGIQGTSEIFDPVTGAFAAGPNMLEPRAMHTSTTLTDGRVLIAGGLTLVPIVNIPTVSATAYRFSYTTNSFGIPALFSGARFLHTAVPTSNGKVLLIGGLTLDLTTFLQTLNLADLVIGTRDDCQLYTAGFLGIGTFATVPGMQEGRAGAVAAMLPNGEALIAGGFRLVIDPSTLTFSMVSTATADLFSQGPNAIVPVGPLTTPRVLGSSVNLPDGTVLIYGGGLGTEIFQR